MGKIFVGQERLSITLDTELDLTGADSVYIKYQKPDKSTGIWDGVVIDSTKVRKVFADGSGGLDQPGKWRFWTYAVFPDGRDLPGELYELRIYTEGVEKTV